MVWSTLPTYSDGMTLTGAHLEAIAANIEETAVAKATSAGQHFVATAPNAVAARTTAQAAIEDENFRTITSYAPLSTAGPSITMTTGVKALVWFQSALKNNVGGSNAYVAVDVSGATSLGPEDFRAIIWQGNDDQYSRYGACNLPSTTPGSNTFSLHYRVDGNQGAFKWRRIQVMGF